MVQLQNWSGLKSGMWNHHLTVDKLSEKKIYYLRLWGMIEQAVQKGTSTIEPMINHRDLRTVQIRHLALLERPVTLKLKAKNKPSHKL